MTKPLAVFVGFIGKLPLAGMALANIHMISGLQTLGYDVHYVEHQNKPEDCYNPETNSMTDDPRYALSYMAALLPRFGIGMRHYSFIDRENTCHGSGWPTLRQALDRADFVLTLADPSWFDELERCPRRAFVDADPMFTQVAMETGRTERAASLAHYAVLFTYGVRIGKEDCLIPSAGRTWLPARMAVDTALWSPTSVTSQLPVSALMNWSSGSECYYQGRAYGYKDREFDKFADLPQRSPLSFSLAVGGGAPRARLSELGWELLSPLAITHTIEGYQEFIANSWADLGIAKHAYVASRSGWFSDRSTCFMAAGRPVLHQDTGCGDWLPTGEGVFLFSGMEDVLVALDRLTVDYDRHARAARELAEEYFAAHKVIGQILDLGGLR
jgi:hypothetical protein